MVSCASSIEEIETAVSRLSKDQLARFRRWFDEYDGQVWDAQIEQDVQAGKLDALAREALAEYEAGRCKPL